MAAQSPARSTRPGRRLVPCAAGVAALLALLAAQIASPAPFAALEGFAADRLQSFAPRPPGPAPVLVVDVDEESLSRHGQWPWPRTVMADLVTALQDLGSGAIALDMVFAEPDRTSPSTLVEAWRRRFDFQPAPGTGPLPDHDALLAAAFARGRVVAGFAPANGDAGASPAHLAPFAVIGAAGLDTLPRFSGAVTNIPVLDAAAAGHGSFSVKEGADETNRSLPMLVRVGERPVPSLALETLRLLRDEDTFKVRVERVGDTVTGYTVRVGDVDVPLDAAGALRLRFPKARTTPTVPAWKVLDAGERGHLRSRFAGAAVFVGTSAVGLADLRPTPMTAFEPGVDLHAIALDQVLAGENLVRPAWARGVERVATVILGLAVILAAAGTAPATALAVLLLTLALPLGATWILFDRANLLFDATLPCLALGLAFVATILVRHAGTERASRQLRAAFTHYLSPDLVAVLARDPGRLKLGGETREMTFLFTDLEGFTAMTEANGAEALVQRLNAYLDGMCSIAMEHGGTVDKIVGDAVHVMFNAPLDQPDHADRAVACALALDAFAQSFKEGQKAAGLAFGVTRIGVNTGPAVVGNFGGSRRFDYTAHGDAINTAARLESANKALGTRICVSKATCEKVSRHAFRPVGTLLLKGKSVGVDVFEPVAGPAADASAYRAAFAGLAAGEEGAAQDLLRLHAADPRDPILALHARRIQAGARDVRIAA